MKRRAPRAGTTRAAIAVCALLALCSACTSDGESDGDRRSPRDSIAARLTRGLRFPQSMVLDGPLPESSDSRIALLALGPAVLVEPSETGLMALRVEDPEQRSVGATLIQFSDAPSYVRVAPEEGEGAHVVENTFTAQSDLCDGLCDAIFTATVTEAVEFEDGAISEISTRQIVIDCRDAGDPDACDVEDDGVAGEPLLCGDVTTGELAWTDDPVLDAHLEAVRLLSEAAAAAGENLASVRADMARALELSPASDAEQVAGALGDAIAAHAQSGVSLLLGEQGCAVTAEQVGHALHACDPETAAAPAALSCAGVCQPSGDVSPCAAAERSGCSGLLDDEPCEGACLGACELTFDEPAECVGTCVGSCDGECPGGPDDCQGPCSGLCTGTCRVLSDGACDGPCTGLCDVAAEGLPDCSEPLAAYCVAASGDALACAGDCFAAGALEVGATACKASALGVGRALPRCEPALVQLSFAFRPAAEPAAQAEFAALVGDLNAPLAQVFGALARLELLLAARSDLLIAAEDEIAARLQALQADPDAAQVACAEQRLPEADAWLAGESAVLEQLRSDAMLLLSPLEIE